MSEKYYVVTTYTKEQYDEISAELKSSYSTPETIPDRVVYCTDAKEHSDVRGEFSLTEDEATTLKSDDRVKVINESPNRYPETYMPPPDELKNQIWGTAKDRWDNAYNNYQTWTDVSGNIRTEFTNAEPSINRTTALYRMQTKQNPWKTSSTNEEDRISSKVQQQGAGENVDVICADNGTWIAHTEFINKGVNNAVNPVDYKPGNVLDRSGYCDVLDVVLDGPYYIDPDWFNANPDSRLETRWDGTVVPTESAAQAWWRDSAQRSPAFASFGNILVSTNYTRDLVHGSPTTLAYDADHGTQCASLIYGRTHGWAYNCNKWHLNLYGDTYNVGSFEIGFDVQKVFHQNKPVNPVFGTRDPTISSNSWGFRSSTKSGSYYYFRTDGAASYGGYTSEPNFISWLGQTGDSGRWKSEMYDNSTTQAGDELTQAGVICVMAAGNSNQPQYNPDHPNYDNRISNNNTNTFYQDTFTEFGYNVTGSTNRRGFPQHIGKTESQTSQGNTTVKFPAINVGCLDDDMTNSYDQDRKVNYSDCGNAIDFFAPGDGTLAACPDATYGTDTSRSDGEYADLSAISACRDTRFSGTSAACPVGAGLVAVVMQYNRSWTYENLRNWIQTSVEVQPSSDMYEGTEVTTAGGSWSSDYNALQGADRRVLYAATIPINTPYPADFKMEGPLAITAGHFDKVV
tara:strand:+ start:1116 stop:3167 length:2052 start_codon:yes stop_codon:yes gene_type:complete